MVEETAGAVKDGTAKILSTAVYWIRRRGASVAALMADRKIRAILMRRSAYSRLIILTASKIYIFVVSG